MTLNLKFFNLVVMQVKEKVKDMMKREKLINLSVRHEKQKEKRKRGKCNNLVLWQVFLLEVAVIIDYQPPKRKKGFIANKYSIFLCGEPSKYKKSITYI